MQNNKNKLKGNNKIKLFWRQFMSLNDKINNIFIKDNHEMLIGKEKVEKLYKKAFLEREEETENEFSINTTTWD